MNRFLRTLLIFSGAALLLATALSSAAQHASNHSIVDIKDTISIASISPEPDTVLRRRDQIELVVQVDHVLVSAPSAKLALIVQRESTRPVGLVLERVRVVRAGEGTTEFRENLRVPRGESLHVFVALQPDGSRRTPTVDRITYEVVSN